MNIPPNCTDPLLLFQSNIIDYYHARPIELEDLCLHRFASWYHVCLNTQVTITLSTAQPRYKLNFPYHQKTIRKRTKFLIIRTLNLRETSNDYFYSCLLLYKTHRNESCLLEGYNSAEEAFVKEYHTFDQESVIESNFAQRLETNIR